MNTEGDDAHGALSEKEVRNRLCQEIESATNYGVQYWPIFLRSTSEHVGCCGLRPYDLSRKIYELGFHIRVDHRGYGLPSGLHHPSYRLTVEKYCRLKQVRNPEPPVGEARGDRR